MTKRERLLTAIKGGTPDIVPVSPTIHWRFTEKLLGRYHWKDVMEVNNMVGSIWHWRPPICLGPNSALDPRWGMQTKVIGQRGTEKTYEKKITNKSGEITSIYSIGFDENDPTLGFTRKYFVGKPEDWDVVETYWQEEIEEVPEPEHEELDQSRDILGDNGAAGTINESTFARLCIMRGLEGVLLDLVDMPDRMHALMDLAYQYREREVKTFIKSKGDIYTYDICWATGANISPKMFEEWVYPDLCKICDLVKGQPDKYIGLYTLGKIKEFMDMMADAGPSFIASFEQNQGDITLAEVKKKYGKKICLIGNFDPLVLQNGTLEDARKEARRCLEEGMEGGGYVMSTGDEVPSITKLDNLKAMVEIAEKYGRY